MKTPWCIWGAGLLSLLWHRGGACGHAMAKTRNAAYPGMAPAKFRADSSACLNGYPFWAPFGRVLGVWAAVLRSALILLRSRLAVTVFYASVTGLIITSAHSGVLAEKNLSMMAMATAKPFTVAILVILLLVTWSACPQRGLGRLR